MGWARKEHTENFTQKPIAYPSVHSIVLVLLKASNDPQHQLAVWEGQALPATAVPWPTAPQSEHLEHHINAASPRTPLAAGLSIVTE